MLELIVLTEYGDGVETQVRTPATEFKVAFVGDIAKRTGTPPACVIKSPLVVMGDKAANAALAVVCPVPP